MKSTKFKLEEKIMDIQSDEGLEKQAANLKRLEHSIAQMEQGSVIDRAIEELERMAYE